MYSIKDMNVRERCLIEVKKCHKSIEGNFMINKFLGVETLEWLFQKFKRRFLFFQFSKWNFSKSKF